MNDIKFACPHCSQHIACDGDFAELSIECPSCGGTMVVPRLAAASSEHGSMVIVASTTLPTPRPTQSISPPAFFSERRLAEQFGNETEENPAMAALWLASLFGTLVLTFVFLANGLNVGSAVACLVIGGAITGFLKAKGGQKTLGESFLSAALFAVALVILTPALALGILFVGCAACSQ